MELYRSANGKRADSLAFIPSQQARRFLHTAHVNSRDRLLSTRQVNLLPHHPHPLPRAVTYCSSLHLLHLEPELSTDFTQFDHLRQYIRGGELWLPTSIELA